MRSQQRSRCGVIFDGDDTLWATEQLYDVARAKARSIIEAHGLSGDEWEKLERHLDVENFSVYGYSQLRFPTSCVSAYERISQVQRVAVDSRVAGDVANAARTVFESNPPLVPHAHEVLTELRERGVRLALLTKGDAVVQQRRIQTSGLRDLFDPGQVVVVEEKTPSVFLDIAHGLRVETSSTWTVGNSIRSDILPALAAGLRAIWIDAHVWEHERSHNHVVDGRIVTLRRLTDVLEVLSSTVV